MCNRILSILFPDRCIVCNRVLPFCADRICLCDACQKRLTFLQASNTCKTCGRPVESGERLCQTCQTHKHHFDHALSCLLYTGATRSAILRFKFGGRRDYCHTFAAIMQKRLTTSGEGLGLDMIVSVPLSNADKNERGYNQTDLLAGLLARNLHLTFIKKAFVKVRETQKQSSLHYIERWNNVHRAYRLVVSPEVIRGKRVLLVDDVLTTGATADELSRLLKRAGAAYVLVLTIASPARNRLEKLPQPDLEEDVF